VKTATLKVSSNGNEAAFEPGRTYVVGRSFTSDIVVDDDRVSRRHLVIEPAGEGWTVRDVSSNGTWVDGERMAMLGLSGELKLRLGSPTGPEVVLTDGTATVAPSATATPEFGATTPLPDSNADIPPRLAPPRPLRPMKVKWPRRRWPWITLLAAVVILVAADRIGVAVATTQVVHQVSTSQKLPTKPGARIGGFPFLTQVALGKYSDVHVTIRNLPTPGPRLAKISATLKGVHVPLSAAMRNKVSQVPVDRISASIFVSFADLNGFLKTKPGSLQVGSGDSGLQLTGQLPGLDQALGSLISANIDVGANDFTLVPGDLLGGLGVPVPKSTLSQLTTKVPLAGLPFDLRLLSVKIHSDGVEFAASASHVVLPGK
jgi:hypothetical protein